MPAWRMLALSPAPPEVLRGFAAGLDIEVSWPAGRSQQDVLAALPGIELVLGDWGHALRIGPAELAVAPGLAFVQQPAAGIETLDLAACAAAGIPVASTGGANTVAVAEWCVLAAMALLRQVVAADAAVHAGHWPQHTLPVLELAGARVGILGMGRIGQAAATRFAGMGAQVSYWSRTQLPEGTAAAAWLPFEALLAASDVLVCVLPGGPQTRGLLSERALDMLPKSAYLISAGRGEVIDEDALARALIGGRLAGAAMDVFRAEPLPATSPLRNAPGLLLSPHLSGATVQARLGILRAAAANLGRALRGEPLVDVVNGADPVVRRR